MSNLPISGLSPAGSAVAGTDIYPSVQSVGVGPVQVTAAQLKAFVGASLTLTGTTTIANPLVLNGVSYTFPGANGVAGTVLTNNGSGVLSWTAAGGVTNINADTAVGMGLSFTGGPITSSGTLTLSGTLSVANGGTGATTAAGALVNLLPAMSSATAGYALFNNGAGLTYWAAASGGGGGSGSVTSVNATATGTGMTFSGGPITSSGTLLLGGVLNVAHGGTGGTTASTAMANLLPSQVGNAGKVLQTDGSNNLSWAAVGTGSVTSVGLSGGATGLTVSTTPITTSGTMVIGGTLNITSGGTGASTAAAALNNLLPTQSGNAGKVLTTNGTGTVSWTAAGGVTSVNASGGTTGLAFTGGPVTSTGTLTLTGTLAITNGGTGATTAAAAFTALAPAQTTNAGKFLTTNGTAASWAQTTLAGDSDVAITSPASGNLLQYNSGTGKWTNVALSSVLTAGTGIAIVGGTISLTDTAVTAGSYASLASQTTALTVDAQGRITAATTNAILIDGTQINAASIPNAQLVNSSVTLGSTSVALGSTAATLAGLTSVTVTQGPVNSLDLATKSYVDAQTSALNRLSPVYVASTAAVTLNGAQTVDGVSLTGGERVLVKNQASSADDGVYVVNAGGAWTYASDANTWANYVSASVFVTNGTTNANSTWIQTAPAGGTLGVTAQSWAQQSGTVSYTAGTGLSLVGNQFNNTGVLSFSAGTTGLTPSTGTGGAITLGGTLATTNGGTGLTTVGTNGQTIVSNGTTLAWGNPKYADNITLGAAGDLLYQSAANTTAKLNIGTTGQVLTVAGGVPTWATSTSAAIYRFNITASGAVSSAITTAGLTDAVNNIYVITNTSGTNQTLTTTTFSNATAYPQVASTTTIYLSPKMTAVINTSTVGSNYAILGISPVSGQFTTSFASNTSLTAATSVDAYASVSATATATSLILTVPSPTNLLAGKVFEVLNSGSNTFTVSWTGSPTVTTTLTSNTAVFATWDGDSWVPATINAANILGGAASQIPYQTAANTTAFIANGTAGQYLTSNGALAPTWTSAPPAAFHINLSAGTTIPLAISSASITDADGNFYTITNTGTAQIILTATTLQNAAAYPLVATGTQVTIPVGGTVGINTITAGSIYSLDVVSPLTGQSGNIAITGSQTLTAATTVDKFGVIRIVPNATGYTVSIPAPTNAAAGQFVTITNGGSSTLLSANSGALTYTLAANATVTLYWNGTAYSVNGSLVAPQTTYNLSLSTSSSVTTLLSNAGITDAVGNIYVISNSGSAANVTGTFTGFAAFPGQATASAITVSTDQILTLVTTTAGSAWQIQNMALLSNLFGGVAGSVPYQSAPNTTGMTAAGTAGQYLMSNGASPPSWESTPAPVFYVRISANDTIPNIITANAITDVVGNTYAIENTSTSNVTVTSTAINAYPAYPTQATATSIVIPPGSIINIVTVSVGNTYAINATAPISGFVQVPVTTNLTLTASSTIDKYNVIQLSPTGSGFTVNIPTPTNTLAGKVLFLSNNTAANLVIYPLNGSAFTLAPASCETLIWEGGAWYGPSNSAASRAYQFSQNSNQNLSTILSAAGVSDVDGNIYSLTNINATSNITITVASINNRSSMGNSSSPASNQIVIRPYETITIQTYTANSSYAFIASTEPQDWTCRAVQSSMGTPPANQDTTINFRTDNAGTSGGYDPAGAFNSSTHTWTCPREGIWLIHLQVTCSNSSTTNYNGWNQQIRVNGSSSDKGALGFGLAMPTSGSGSGTCTTITQVKLSVGDTVYATIYPYGNTNLTPVNNSSQCQLTFALVG